MFKDCLQCGGSFEVTEEDLQAYDRLSPVFDGKIFPIPTPTLCPLCRQQRRLSFRNERKLYTRKSDFSGKQIISIYSQDKPYKVYDQDEWWSDKWDPMIYGRDYDFSRSFAEQFRALYVDVPRVSMHILNSENCYYNSYLLFCKNCYLLNGGGHNEDCMFGKYISFSKDVLNALCVYSSEFCYEIVASDGCYGCRFLVNCRNCSDCTMVEDCIGCKNCMCCFGLRSKEYCVANQFLGKEQYEQFVKGYEYLTHKKIDFLRGKLEGLKAKLPHVQSHIYASENCSGDAVFNSKNCHFAYDVKDSEDCKFLHNSPKCVGTYDAVYCAPDGLQFCYNVCSCVGTNLMATYFVWYCDNVRYSMDCLNSQDLFGCVGLRSKRYCIFNRQYSKEEYEKLVAKIVEKLVADMEWGEFLPYSLAPCDYNESVAMEYFPIGEGEARKIRARWKNDMADKKLDGVVSEVPEDIREVDENILNRVFKCEMTGREYKIQPRELKFYQRIKVPIPRRHHDQRHYDRLKLHGAHRLWQRKCDKCGESIQTVYGEKDKFAVYCEKCYLKVVY